jgi:predicted dinucleotide-binding enzyme
VSTIACIGLGIMGGPMAKHLVNAGHTVIGGETGAIEGTGDGNLDHSALLRGVERLSGRSP